MTTHPRNHIVPPYLLRHLATTTEPIADYARATLTRDQRYRHTRATGTAGQRPAMAVPVTAGPSRRISDAANAEQLPGKTVRDEGAPATGDAAVDEAYDGFGATWKLYDEIYDRNSIDGSGLRLLGTVHYGEGYQNAFWNGTRMVFGDGDGEIFGRFTASLDVIGHELTHGVVEHTAALAYSGQSGALNESVADVFGVLVKQYALGQDAATADWLIGGDLLLPGVKGVALRSMLHPGTAYDDPRLGKDPQPDTMSGYVETTEDNGGVHYNSGIPNRAFALAATAIGGPAWERAGRIWYDVLTGGALKPDADFAAFAQLTIAAAGTRFGAESPEAAAVRDGWTTVGVGPGATNPTPGSGKPPVGSDAELLLRRTGGFAGIPRQRQAKLAELPPEDRRTWQGLLADDLLPRLAAESSPRPDAFAYCVTCMAVELDVEVAEPDLPERIRRLFERTLSGE
ncbi:MAG TPA: protealysin inhibitor emfourin [Propionicimonas sp.]|jgi:Zn-dependent metalloprotease|uniref:protealysin inhibitor emfourin n=1 Tax=Propionicimonas sp. TaxID=1955623 RepID=UPI002F3F1F5B